jgi:hypothetical protein
MEIKKVITAKKKPSMKAEIVLVSFVVMIIGVGMFMSFNFGITGNVALSVETIYDPNSTLEGELSLALKPGELIPKDSVVSISMGNDSYDFVLSELVDEGVVEGNFYGEGLDLNGSGEGYGVIGSKDIFTDVEFSMRIFEDSSSGNFGKGKGSGNSGNSGNSGGGEVIVVEEESGEEVEGDEDVVEGEDVVENEEEEVVEDGEEVEVSEDEVVEDEEEEVEVEDSEEEVEEVEEEVEEVEDEVDEEPETSGITGGVVASLELIVDGIVRGDESYVYELEEGQTAEIVSSSQSVSLEIEGNVVTVSTSYSEGETGFGVEYLGDDFDYEIEVDLTALELDVEEGELVVSLDYGDSEIASVSTTLSVDDPNQVSSTVTSLPLEIEDLSDFSLSTDESFALKAGTGKDVIEISKAEEFNGRLLIRFEAGKYWLENSYDLGSDDLKYQIELDRAKFTKRLAGSFLETEEESVSVEGYLGVESLIAIEESLNESVEEVVEVVEEVEEEVVEEVIEVIEEASIEDIQEAFEEATS